MNINYVGIFITETNGYDCGICKIKYDCDQSCVHYDHKKEEYLLSDIPFNDKIKLLNTMIEYSDDYIVIEKINMI